MTDRPYDVLLSRLPAARVQEAPAHQMEDWKARYDEYYDFAQAHFAKLAALTTGLWTLRDALKAYDAQLPGYRMHAQQDVLDAARALLGAAG